MATKGRTTTKDAGKSKALALHTDINQEDAQLLEGLGADIKTFVAHAFAFLTVASDLETKAKASLARIQAMPAPTTMEEDDTLQREIRQFNADKRAIEDHWTICSKVHQFHRKLTGRRDIGVKALEEAATIGNRRHNAWVESERRRIADEIARQERQAREEAEAVRRAEIARLEQERLEAEASAPDLSDREKDFVRLIVLTGCAPDVAAERAGFKRVGYGQTLMASGKITAALKSAYAALGVAKEAERLQAAPLEVAPVEVPTVNLDKGTVTRWKAEVVDEARFIDAVLRGGYGIPTDCLTINTVKLNEYARSLHKLIDKWPGVKAVEETKVR